MAHKNLVHRLTAVVVLAAAVLQGSNASALICGSETVGLNVSARCKHPTTGKNVAAGGFSQGARGDQFLSVGAGFNGGMPANVTINRLSALTFDANGARVLDCQVASTDPDGVFVNFFGFLEATCDDVVALRITANFDDI